MRVEPLDIDGVVKIWPQAHSDNRGFFFESFRRDAYLDAGIGDAFVQDNRSGSKRHVLRGLHYQINRPQGHLVTITAGCVFDVGVDLRAGSRTFGRSVTAELSADPPVQLYLPPGVAHGFCVLSETAEIWYKCTDYYQPGDEAGVLWNDPDLAIQWPVDRPIMVPRDTALPRLKDVPESRLPKSPASSGST